MKAGDTVVCVNDKILASSGIKPLIKVGDEFVVKEVLTTKNGENHLDVGIKSKYNYISDYKSGEELRDGDKIHWCHASRFEVKNNER